MQREREREREGGRERRCGGKKEVEWDEVTKAPE